MPAQQEGQEGRNSVEEMAAQAEGNMDAEEGSIEAEGMVAQAEESALGDVEIFRAFSAPSPSSSALWLRRRYMRCYASLSEARGPRRSPRQERRAGRRVASQSRLIDER